MAAQRKRDTIMANHFRRGRVKSDARNGVSADNAAEMVANGSIERMYARRAEMNRVLIDLNSINNNKNALFRFKFA